MSQTQTPDSDDSPLGQMHTQHGTTSMKDLQRKQAEARGLQEYGKASLPKNLSPMSAEDIDDLKQMATEYGAELVDLNKQLATLQAKIAETSVVIGDINNRIAQAEYKPLAELNRDYFEQQKADLEARFAQSRRIKEALAGVGVVGSFDYNLLGNGPSPLDQAIAAKNLGRRQTTRVGK